MYKGGMQDWREINTKEERNGFTALEMWTQSSREMRRRWQVEGGGRWVGVWVGSRSEAEVGHTHQRLVNSPVESGHRVCPCFPVVAPTDVRQPPLALEAALRVWVVVLTIMRVMVVASQVAASASHVHVDVQEVLLDAALPGQCPLPACGQGTSFHRALAVDQTHAGPHAHAHGASSAVRVHGSVAQGALFLAAAVQPAVGALCSLSNAHPPRAAGSPVVQGGVAGWGALALQSADALARGEAIVLPWVLMIDARTPPRRARPLVVEAWPLAHCFHHNPALRFVLRHLRDAVKTLTAHWTLPHHLPLQIPVVSFLWQVLPLVVSLSHAGGKA